MAENVIRVNFGAAVDGEDFGTVSLADVWLSTAQAAQLAGMTPASWRSLVRRGYLPAPDDPGVGPVNRRSPRWLRSTVVAGLAARPGQGRRRRG